MATISTNSNSHCKGVVPYLVTNTSKIISRVYSAPYYIRPQQLELHLNAQTNVTAYYHERNERGWVKCIAEELFYETVEAYTMKQALFLKAKFEKEAI